MLDSREKYGKFNVGSRPMRIREYTAMNNNYNYVHVTSIKKQIPRSWAAYIWLVQPQNMACEYVNFSDWMVCMI